jgi:cyclophilin family peptidyl-prolyl cis-trans isomerase
MNTVKPEKTGNRMPSVTVQAIRVIAQARAKAATWRSKVLRAPAIGRQGRVRLSIAAALVSLLAHLAAPLAAHAAKPRVTLHTTLGDIVLELDDERAPQTVKNFLTYVEAGFYDDTLFHRVIDGFMIQGGGFDKNYQRKSTRAPVSNEAYNGLRNQRYTIAMARTTAPHSATSQFFINSEDNDNLDHTNTTQRGWGYAVFGRVVEGKDVVDAISQVRTGPGGPFSRDVPLEPVVITGASLYRPSETLSSSSNNNQPSSAAAGPVASSPLKPMDDGSSGRKPLQSPIQPVEQN